MPAIQFLNPIFLAGLGAVLVPIIIHLLFRRRKKTVIFSSLRFLRKITEERARRLQIKEWLLLIMRSLALALLALAFARPFTKNLAQEPAARTDTLILLDDSYSMMARHDSGSCFDKARQIALQLPDDSRPGDRFAIVTTSRGGRVVLELTSDHSLFAGALRRLNPSLCFTQYWPAFKTAHGLIARSDAQRKKIVFLTDAQLASWGGMNKATALPGIATSIQVKPRVVHPVETSNIAILQVNPPPRVWSAKEPLRVFVKIANYGRRPAKDVPVIMRWGRVPGAPAPSSSQNIQQSVSKTMAIDPGEVAVISMVIRPAGKHDIVGDVNIPARDVLEVDNRAFVSIPAEEEIRVLCVEEQLEDRPYLHATYYFGRALQPTTNFRGHQAGYVQVQTISADLVETTDLNRFHIVVLANVTALARSGFDRLESFIRGGGGIIVYLGRRIDRDAYNSEAFRDGNGWLPGYFREEVAASTHGDRFFSLLVRKPDHGMFMSYTEETIDELGSARFFRFVSVRPEESSDVIAVYDNDEPAIIEKRTGDGRCILFTSSCDTEWNDLAKRGTFVPLVHQLVRYLAPRDRESRSMLLLEDPLSLALGQWIPGNERNALMAVDPANRPLLLSQPAGTCGLFGIRDKVTGQVLRYVAVNLDTRESDLAPVQSDDLAAITTRDEAAGEKLSGPAWEDKERLALSSPVWRFILYVLLLLLCVELFLANRF